MFQESEKHRLLIYSIDDIIKSFGLLSTYLQYHLSFTNNYRPRGPFFKRPDNFSGPELYFKIRIYRMVV